MVEPTEAKQPVQKEQPEKEVAELPRAGDMAEKPKFAAAEPADEEPEADRAE